MEACFHAFLAEVTYLALGTNPVNHCLAQVFLETRL